MASNDPGEDGAGTAGGKGGVEDRRRGTLRALAPEVQRLTRRKLGRHSPAEAGLLTEWPSIVGREIARVAVPRGIRFPRHTTRREGTLELRVAAAHATRLKHQEPMLVERVNGYFGYKAVAALRLIHDGRLDRDRAERETNEAADTPAASPETEHRVTQQVAGIPDEGLREALARLGRTISARRD